MRGEKGDKGEAGERVSAFHTYIWLRLLLLFFSSFIFFSSYELFIYPSVCLPVLRYSVCQSRGRSVGQSVGRAIDRSVSRSDSKPIGWLVSRSVGRPIDRSISLSVG